MAKCGGGTKPASKLAELGEGRRSAREAMREICHICSVELEPGLPTVDALLKLPSRLALSLVLSLDGQLVGPDHSSRSISGAEDLHWLRTLRASSDAVLVGAATAAAEGYKPFSVGAEFAPARRKYGLAVAPQLVVLHSSDDLAAVRAGLGPRLLLEAGIRLHTALSQQVDRVWLSHSPTMTGDGGATFDFDLRDFQLVERHVGQEFAVSRFERINRR